MIKQEQLEQRELEMSRAAKRLYLERWGELPQRGSITLHVLHGVDGDTPVTIPLNDCVSSLVSLITAEVAAAQLRAATQLASAPVAVQVDASVMAMTGAHSPSAPPAGSPSAPAAGAGGAMGADAYAVVRELGLEEWSSQLLALGADTLDRLKAVEDVDLASIGMPLLHRRSLLRALGQAVGGAGGVGRGAIVDAGAMDGAELVQAGRAEHAAARWEYEHHGWKPLAPETNAAIEAALAGSQTTVTVQHRHWTCKCQKALFLSVSFWHTV